MKIWGVECPECKARLFSFHVHHYRQCDCPNEAAVDGGREYLRVGWKDKKPKRICWSDKKDGNYEMCTAAIKEIKE
jgi:hypothetical protein